MEPKPRRKIEGFLRRQVRPALTAHPLCMIATVQTYFHPLPTMDAGREHELVVLWQKSWRRCGFEPVILTHLVAEAHPRFAEYDALVRSFPTVNPVGYDLACWHRWLALDVIGGGILTDYDVIANDFSVELLTQLPDEVTILDRGGVPCCVYAIGDGPSKIVEAILGRKFDFGEVNGKPHFSDMLAMQQIGWPKAPALTAPFGADDWKTAPAVHFSHSDCSRERPGKDRAAVIRREMQLV